MLRGHRLARSASGASLSVVVPTYRESANIPELVARLERVRDEHDLDLELLIMDDDSRDGTVEVVEELKRPWVRLIVRTSDRGLSQSVCEGFAAARGDAIAVMDADLSHPPEALPAMLDRLLEGNEMVIGSRYVAGGSTDDSWGVHRWLTSRGATVLARPLTRVRDPMSGYFIFRRDALASGAALNPIGFKIGLELLVKKRFERIAEVPIEFRDRTRGQSKLGLREQMRYVQHLRRLFIFRYPELAALTQFLTVGASGLVVNLVVLTIALAVAVPLPVAVALAIGFSMIWNFALHRRFTFSYARAGRLPVQFTSFVLACSVGALVNYGVTLGIVALLPEIVPQIAACGGVLAGTAFNYVASRYVVFAGRHR